MRIEKQKIWCAKIRYETRQKAQKAMVNVKEGGRRRKGKKPLKETSSREKNVYKCAICGSWHWGHKPTKNIAD